MRDRLSYNSFCLLPIVHDEMNGLAAAAPCVKGYAPRISNGYYGYQAVAASNKNERQQQQPQQEQMEVTVAENNEMRNSRKRACESHDEVVLKRRRENDVVADRWQQQQQQQQQQRQYKKLDVRLLEELLRGTHGGDLYNYYGAGDDV